MYLGTQRTQKGYILKEINKDEAHTLSDFKAYSKTTVNKIHWQKKIIGI